MFRLKLGRSRYFSNFQNLLSLGSINAEDFMIVNAFQSRNSLRMSLFGADHFFDVKGVSFLQQLVCDLITDLNEREPSFFAGLIFRRKTEGRCQRLSA
jgi:hypothetical protein